MRRPSTMVMPAEDDQRTLVDFRSPARDGSSEVTVVIADPMGSCSAAPPFEGSGQAVSSTGEKAGSNECPRAKKTLWQRVRPQMSIPGSKLLPTGLLIAIIVGLVLAVHQELRVADELRDALNEMNADASSQSLDLPRPADRPAVAFDERSVPSASGGETMGRDREALEDRGADLIASNDFVQALAHYQMLTQMFPDEDAFRDFVTVLRAKRVCASEADLAGRSCP